MGDRTLDYIALGVLCFVVLTIIYGVIYIHDIPYEMAKKRNHPHQDAIHTAGWVSLFLMHTIWPFLWIWATLYKPEVGWGVGINTAQDKTSPPNEPLQEKLLLLETRIGELELREKKTTSVYTKHIKYLQQQLKELKKNQPITTQKEA